MITPIVIVISSVFNLKCNGLSIFKSRKRNRKLSGGPASELNARMHSRTKKMMARPKRHLIVAFKVLINSKICIPLA